MLNSKEKKKFVKDMKIGEKGYTTADCYSVDLELNLKKGKTNRFINLKLDGDSNVFEEEGCLHDVPVERDDALFYSLKLGKGTYMIQLNKIERFSLSQLSAIKAIRFSTAKEHENFKKYHKEISFGLKAVPNNHIIKYYTGDFKEIKNFISEVFKEPEIIKLVGGKEINYNKYSKEGTEIPDVVKLVGSPRKFRNFCKNGGWEKA